MTQTDALFIALILLCAMLIVLVYWVHDRFLRAETRLRYLELHAGQKQPGPIPTPQEQAAQEANPFYPHQPQPPIGTVWSEPWTPRHRPNLPKEDKAGKERDTQERMRQTREAVPYGFRSGDEPRPIE